MAEFGAYNDPGTGSGIVGHSMIVQFSGGKLLQIYNILAQNMSAEDWEKVLNALAGIPGCTYALVGEGAVTERFMEPSRTYEPLPPPVQD